MSSTPPHDGQPAGAGNAPSLRVLAQYLKDHSFENPNAPRSFMEGANPPTIDVGVDVSGRTIGTDQYEVELSVSAQAKRGTTVTFVVETTYAGVFEIRNVPQDQMEPVMLIECPRLLFPFVRQIVADTTIAGNFPPVLLDPIDFYAIYQQRRGQALAQNGAEAARA